MDPLLAFVLIAAVVIGIGALAILGVRRARAMSHAHQIELKRAGRSEQLARPRTLKDHFLRPMPVADVLLAIAGAAGITALLRYGQSWFGG
jgi:D-arabinose 1-dehydrogenase-like Zn-dependent alcohol dehydrogenase